MSTIFRVLLVVIEHRVELRSEWEQRIVGLIGFLGILGLLRLLRDGERAISEHRVRCIVVHWRNAVFL